MYQMRVLPPKKEIKIPHYARLRSRSNVDITKLVMFMFMAAVAELLSTVSLFQYTFLKQQIK